MSYKLQVEMDCFVLGVSVEEADQKHLLFMDIDFGEVDLGAVRKKIRQLFHDFSGEYLRTIHVSEDNTLFWTDVTTADGDVEVTTRYRMAIGDMLAFKFDSSDFFSYAEYK